MTIFNLTNLGALVRNLIQETCRAGGIGGPAVDSVHAYRIALAEAEATRDARLDATLAPLTEAIARVQAKVDAILAKLEK
jgi:hypothetical protein